VDKFEQFLRAAKDITSDNNKSNKQLKDKIKDTKKEMRQAM